MAQGKTVLILGGGIVVASQLRRALSREHRVVLVEQASTHWGKVAYEKYWFYKWF